MTDSKLLGQARRGDAIAIAALLNKSLQPQGIWARVEPDPHGLHILLESTQAPDSEQMEQRIRAGLGRLQPQGISQVVVSGFALGATEPAWERNIRLNSSTLTKLTPPGSSLSPPQLRPTFPGPKVATPKTQPTSRQGNARSPQKPTPNQPFVLKWSDFDPMMLAITGFVAVFGFSGALNPSYDGPFMWLHFPNLAIHETGHLLFLPFGEFLMILGGSLTQIAFPAVFTGYFFYSQQFFSSALTLFWTGQNFMDVAVYMRDAPYRELPLTVDNIDAHDWWQLFNRLNCLNQAELIANLTHGVGVILYVASVIAGIYVAYLTKKSFNERHTSCE